MSMNDLLQQALLLPEQERVNLACELLQSVVPGNGLSEDEWREEWALEIASRIQRFERGETTARDWKEALVDIRATLQRKP